MKKTCSEKKQRKKDRVKPRICQENNGGVLLNFFSFTQYIQFAQCPKTISWK